MQNNKCIPTNPITHYSINTTRLYIYFILFSIKATYKLKLILAPNNTSHFSEVKYNYVYFGNNS